MVVPGQHSPSPHVKGSAFAKLKEWFAQLKKWNRKVPSQSRVDGYGNKVIDIPGKGYRQPPEEQKQSPPDVFICGNCSHEIHSSRLPGTVVRCPSCKEKMVVPGQQKSAFARFKEWIYPPPEENEKWGVWHVVALSLVVIVIVGLGPWGQDWYKNYRRTGYTQRGWDLPSGWESLDVFTVNKVKPPYPLSTREYWQEIQARRVQKQKAESLASDGESGNSGAEQPAEANVQVAQESNAQETKPLEPDAIAAKLKPSVATLVLSNGKQGTGFALKSNGWLVTNHHVVDGTKSGSAMIDGISLKIEDILLSDKKRDLAIIKLDTRGKKLRVIPLAPESRYPKQGDRIYVMGSPKGLEGSFTDGIVSSTQRERIGFTDFIQHTAAIEPGSSGSPVVNSRGELVAIVTDKLRDSQALNFAVHVSELRELLDGS